MSKLEPKPYSPHNAAANLLSIIMQGSSPYNVGFQSPSFHSSSYLPKLEANFMKDFTCCGLTLPSLHDLLQHFEEAHAQQMPPPAATQYPTQNGGNNAGPSGSGMNGQIQQSLATTSNAPASTVVPANTLPPQQSLQSNSSQANRQAASAAQDMDNLEDMEMDDMNGPSDFSSNPGYPIPEADQYSHRNQFGQPRSAAVPPLDLNSLNNPFQGIRQSQPTTPVSGGRAFHNNPTVSSVNTPTLSAHPLQQQFRTTPDSSAPGTPGELDADFVGNLQGMSMDAAFMQNQADFGNANFGYGGQNELLELCIDDPAKRLFSPNGASTQQNPQNRLGNAQYGPNSEIARRIREQQRKVGLPDTVGGANGEEPKPFRCPVIGCEKAYKNQNGLKYHKSVSNTDPRC
jgi:transcription factor SFP1